MYILDVKILFQDTHQYLYLVHFSECLIFISAIKRNKKTSHRLVYILVRLERLELSRIAPLPPEDSASASSATTAKRLMVRLVRLELTRSKLHYPLKIARLPVPPQPHAVSKWCLRAESNCRHVDFQSTALPTELPRQNR